MNDYVSLVAKTLLRKGLESTTSPDQSIQFTFLDYKDQIMVKSCFVLRSGNIDRRDAELSWEWMGREL